jgi:hypothetical protein
LDYSDIPGWKSKQKREKSQEKYQVFNSIGRVWERLGAGIIKGLKIKIICCRKQ